MNNVKRNRHKQQQQGPETGRHESAIRDEGNTRNIVRRQILRPVGAVVRTKGFR